MFAIAYSVKLTTTSTFGCIDSLIKTVTIYPKPKADFTAPRLDSCSVFTVLTNNTSLPYNGETLNSMSFNWTTSNGLSSTATSPSFSLSNTGIVDSVYSIKLIATTSHGCKDTITKFDTVFPNPKSNFNPTITVSCAPFTITNAIINLTTYPFADDTYKLQKIIWKNTNLTFKDH